METKTHLKDQVAIVTGGAGTLGRAVVRRFTDAGFRVLAVDVVVPLLDEIVPNASPDRIAAVRADLGTVEAAETVVREAIERFGDVHVLAHLVGGWSGKPVGETSLEEWEAQFAVNLLPAFLMCRAVVPLMVEHRYGRIVCVGSRTTVRPTANQAAYTASKAGVIALVQTLAEEVKHAGVTVNCVLPSVIDTPANRKAMPKSDPDHWVKPERLAEVIRFLCSPESAEITGAAIPVYGRA